MVTADNEMKQKDRVVEDNLVFGNVAAIGVTPISRTLAKHRDTKCPSWIRCDVDENMWPNAESQADKKMI